MDEFKEAKEMLIKSVEKLVVLNQNQSKEISELKDRVKKLEDEQAIMRMGMQIHQSNVGIANFHANAEEDLYNYMMEVKDDDAIDLPMTKKDVEREFKKYANRKQGKPAEDPSELSDDDL